MQELFSYFVWRHPQRVLGLPRQVTLEELKDALQGVTEEDGDQTVRRILAQVGSSHITTRLMIAPGNRMLFDALYPVV